MHIRTLGVAFLALHLVLGMQSGSPAPPTLSPQASLFFLKANVRSTNWSGYVTTGATFSDVVGSWKQPQVDCASQPEAFATFWVGLGGFRTHAVEQIGTGLGCYEGGIISYSWYQLFPNPPVTLPRDMYPVTPGDALNAAVTTNDGGKSFALTLHSARGWTFTTQERVSAAQMASAECIAEAPSYGGILALVDFGAVTFGGCAANGKPLAAAPQPAMLTMFANGAIKAAPSWLDPQSSGFTVKWFHS